MSFTFERDSSYFDMIAVHAVENTNFNKVVHVATETEAKELCEWLNTMEEKITERINASMSHCQLLDNKCVKELDEALKSSHKSAMVPCKDLLAVINGRGDYVTKYLKIRDIVSRY